jgi:hypothetical protein
MGQIFDLGYFTKDPKLKEFIKIQIYHDKELLGECNIDVFPQINVETQAREESHMLSIGAAKAGIITVQTRF